LAAALDCLQAAHHRLVVTALAAVVGGYLLVVGISKL
jgi:hypothetical protein